MSNIRQGPSWLAPLQVAQLLQTTADQQEIGLLRRLGFTPDEVARLTDHGRDIGVGPLTAAREIVRCSLAVMEGSVA